MIKFTVIFFTLIGSSSSFGETTVDVVESPLAVTRSRRPKARPYRQQSLSPTDHGAPECPLFMDKNGEFLEWGQQVIDAVQRVGQDCFFNQADFSLLCPNFKLMDYYQKMQFIVFVFASIAHDESTCQTTARAQGPYGVAAGLLQLEDAKKLRRQSGRDRVFCASDRPVDTNETAFQFTCGASIFRDAYCDPEKPRVIGDDNHYWQKLNYPTGEVSKMIKKFPYCSSLPPPPDQPEPKRARPR